MSNVWEMMPGPFNKEGKRAFNNFIMRNPIAKALRSPHLAPHRVKPKNGRGSYRRRSK